MISREIMKYCFLQHNFSISSWRNFLMSLFCTEFRNWRFISLFPFFLNVWNVDTRVKLSTSFSFTFPMYLARRWVPFRVFSLLSQGWHSFGTLPFFTSLPAFAPCHPLPRSFADFFADSPGYLALSFHLSSPLASSLPPSLYPGISRDPELL